MAKSQSMAVDPVIVFAKGCSTKGPPNVSFHMGSQLDDRQFKAKEN